MVSRTLPRGYITSVDSAIVICTWIQVKYMKKGTYVDFSSQKQ